MKGRAGIGIKNSNVKVGKSSVTMTVEAGGTKKDLEVEKVLVAAGRAPNVENIGLEAVFPYNLIGDNSSMTALGRRTFASRSYVNSTDWSFDALHAARLGLPTDVKSALLAAIRTWQLYPSGLASFTGQPAYNGSPIAS